MSNTKKALKTVAALVVVFTLSSFGTLLNKTQKAQVVSSVPTSVFSVFNRNDTVLRAQTILKDLGMYSGRLSGLFGYKTRNALLMYQTSIQIPQTGILDLLTQARLFAPPPPPIEYALVDNTVYGNQFLSEWVGYMYENNGNIGEQVEVEGLLLSQSEDISHNDRSTTANQSLLASTGEYKVLNISNRNLDDYAGQNVRIVGYIFENQADISKPILVTNYTSEVISEDEYPMVRSTEDGRDEAYDFVRDHHKKEWQYVNLTGYFSIQSNYMSYDSDSHPTRVMFVGNGDKYAVENISEYDLEELGDVNVTVRGFLLDGQNQNGLPTIVISYIPDYDGMAVVGYTAEGNTDLQNWIPNTYNESGAYRVLSGTLEQGTDNVVYGSGGYKTDRVLSTAGGEQYSVENISNLNLNNFIGRSVILHGFVLENLNGLSLRTIVINHISGDAGMTVVGYTAQGNADLAEWISSTYNESGVYTRLVGTVGSIARNLVYAPGGGKSRIVIDTEGGERFTVDYSLGTDPSNFIGQDVVIYGYVLQNLNAAGIRTIAINHIE